MSKHRVHALKTWPPFFEAVIAGDKTFEIRRDDRGFAVGDLLLLQEWDPQTMTYTGREKSTVVSYLLHDMGLRPGYVAIGLAKPEGLGT